MDVYLRVYIHTYKQAPPNPTRRLPRLKHGHQHKHDRWFVTIYANLDTLPLAAVLRVWDTFVSEGCVRGFVFIFCDCMYIYMPASLIYVYV